MMIMDRKLINNKKVAFADWPGGERIEDIMNEVVNLMTTTNKYDECRFEINGVKMAATKDSNAEALVKEFRDKIRRK